jgi:hypothetical protein
MTTTKTQPTDPAAVLVPIEEQLQVAREERARLGQEARAWADGVAGLEAELSALARSDASQFGSDGQPKPKSRAAELRAEITKRTNGQKWPEILEGADQRIRNLENELNGAVEANAEALARAEYEGPGKAAADKIKHGAALIAEGQAEYVASEQRLMGICTATQGLNAQDIVSDPRVVHAARATESLDDLAPPRSRSLTPMSEETPPRYRIRSGGFVRSPHPDDVADVPQPERVEA